MLVFSTKLYVKKELTNNLFIQKALDWVGKSPNYTFNELDWNDDKEEYIVESEDKAQKLTIMKYKETVIVNLVNKDGKIIWTNDYVLTVRNKKRILAVQLYSDAEDISAKLPTKFNRPRLLKMIIKEGYGDFDDDLQTNDNCLIITNENLDVIRKIIMNEKEYMMPVVYVTPTLYTSTYKLDYNELAKDLAGVAHVLVEKNSGITSQLKELTEGKNPYNSGVQIYFGKGVSQRILPNKFRNQGTFRQEVADAVFRKLILSKIDDDLSSTKIRLNKVVESNANIEELCQLYDDELKINEKKLEVCNNRIQELEEIKSKYEAKIAHLEQRLEKSSTDNNTGLVLFSQECDFYEEEQKDLILKVIKKEIKTMEDDKNQRETRKYHILKSIIQQNELLNASEKIVSQIRNVFSGNFKMNSATKRKISELGFNIQEGNHYKITYKDDNRYQFTVAKTPSDGRAVQNLRSEILKNLFSTND
ncbi:MAG: hypothetical protein ACI4G1_07790 [Ruminococcus sp.]